MNPSSKQILQLHWGYSTFLPSQEKIIQSILLGRNTIAILPTGAGKSLCFQIPALSREGICLVVSPLLSLMKDQVEGLKKRNIKADYISSEQNTEEVYRIIDNCTASITKILYVSPERLQNPVFIERTQNLNLNLIAIDEAHCITEWGHDFRPSYVKIPKFLALYPQTPVIALTATATNATEKDMTQKLGLNAPKIFRASVEKKNITYQVFRSQNKLDDLLIHCKKNIGPGIIFTRTRKSTYEIAKFLERNQIETSFYHARLSPEEKNARQERWANSQKQVMVATSAFGMGINKPNVRLVVHYDPPNSIESYVQHVGRAGRDGKSAQGVLFYNQADVILYETLFAESLPSKKEFVYTVKFLYNFFQITEGETPKEKQRLCISDFSKKIKMKKGKVQSVMNSLEAQNVIHISSMRTKSRVQIMISSRQIEFHPKQERQVLEQIVRKTQGVFTSKKKIIEKNIAKNLRINTNQVVKALNHLQLKETILYENNAFNSVQFLIPRENRKIENTYWSTFKKIQQNKYQKIKDLQFFVQQNANCRQQLLRSYFGEKKGEKCEKCDVCLQKIKTREDFNIELLDFLRSEPKTSLQIREKFIKHTKQQIIETLDLLQAQGKVKNLSLDLFLASN